MSLLFFGINTFAQTITSNAGSINLSAFPLNPNPGEIVRIEASSLSVDLNGSEIIWSINGITRERAIGRKDFSFTAGQLGEVLRVSVTVISIDGKIITENISITSSEIDLLWESGSYTPPFYKGKALNTVGETVRVIAMPNVLSSSGVKFGAKSLIYAWSFSDYAISEKSGYGKNIFEFRTSPRVNNISVAVYNRNNEFVGSNDITIQTYNPFVLIYEQDPLLGTNFGSAIGEEFLLEKDEVVLDAYPFFFSTQNKDGFGIEYDWSMNGRDISAPGPKNSILTLRRDGEGVSNISVDVRNIDNFFQTTFERLKINFFNR